MRSGTWRKQACVIDVVQLCRGQQGVHHRGAVAARVRSEPTTRHRTVQFLFPSQIDGRKLTCLIRFGTLRPALYLRVFEVAPMDDEQRASLDDDVLYV